jgi:hypothetical protein
LSGWFYGSLKQSRIRIKKRIKAKLPPKKPALLASAISYPSYNFLDLITQFLKLFISSCILLITQEKQDQNQEQQKRPTAAIKTTFAATKLLCIHENPSYL